MITLIGVSSLMIGLGLILLSLIGFYGNWQKGWGKNDSLYYYFLAGIFLLFGGAFFFTASVFYYSNAHNYLIENVLSDIKDAYYLFLLLISPFLVLKGVEILFFKEKLFKFLEKSGFYYPSNKSSLPLVSIGLLFVIVGLYFVVILVGNILG